jgi:(4S)-4-hydroxy-5-phosphonooxypentane-2,3-dione isomerase
MQALIVDFKIHTAHIEAFAAAMLTNAQQSRDREPGCRQFDVCRDAADAGHFFLYELYDDEAAVQAHLQSAHFLHFNALTADWVAHKQVWRYVRVAPGVSAEA